MKGWPEQPMMRGSCSSDMMITRLRAATSLSPGQGLRGASVGDALAPIQYCLGLGSCQFFRWLALDQAARQPALTHLLRDGVRQRVAHGRGRGCEGPVARPDDGLHAAELGLNDGPSGDRLRGHGILA